MFVATEVPSKSNHLQRASRPPQHYSATSNKANQTYHFLGQICYLAVEQRCAAQLYRDVCRAHVDNGLRSRRRRHSRGSPQFYRRLNVDGSRRIGHVQVEFMFCDTINDY